MGLRRVTLGFFAAVSIGFLTPLISKFVGSYLDAKKNISDKHALSPIESGQSAVSAKSFNLMNLEKTNGRDNSSQVDQRGKRASSNSDSQCYTILTQEVFERPRLFEPSSHFQWTIQNLVFESLLFEDDESALRPRLAKSWHWDIERKTIVFELFREAKWPSGVAITADDVLRSYQAHLDLKNNSIYRFVFREMISSVEKLSEKTVRFKLLQNSYYSLRAIGLNILIYPEELLAVQERSTPLRTASDQKTLLNPAGLDQGQQKFQQNASDLANVLWRGSGLFNLTQFKRDQGVELTANTRIWRSAELQAIQLKAWLSHLNLDLEVIDEFAKRKTQKLCAQHIRDDGAGELILGQKKADQMTLGEDSALAKSDQFNDQARGLSVSRKPLKGMSGQIWFIVNFQHDLLREARHRSLLHQLIDLSALNQRVFNGQFRLATGFFPVEHPFASQNRQVPLLSASGLEQSKAAFKKHPRPLRVIYSREALATMAETTVAKWRALGIRAELKQLESFAFGKAIESLDYDLALVEVTPFYSDLNLRGLITSQFKSPVQQPSYFRDLEALFEQLDREQAPETRKRLMREGDRILTQKLFYLFLFEKPELKILKVSKN